MKIRLFFAALLIAGYTGTSSADVTASGTMVDFPSGDLTLVGTLFKPAGAGPFPAIIWNHGSEPSPGAGPFFDAVANVFVPAGYVVFMPVRRGQGRSQGTYIVDRMEAADEAQGHDAANREMVHLLETEQLQDQLAGLRYIEKLPYVDKARIAVAGCSFGGIETLLAAEAPNDFKAAVALSPAALTWDHNPVIRQRLVAGVKKIDIPVLLLQPAKDASLEPSQVLGEEFRRLGKPYTGMVYPPTGSDAMQSHCFGGAQGVSVWRDDVLRFVSAILKP